MWRKSTLQHFDLGAVISSLLKTPPLPLPSIQPVSCEDKVHRTRLHFSCCCFSYLNSDESVTYSQKFLSVIIMSKLQNYVVNLVLMIMPLNVNPFLLQFQLNKHVCRHLNIKHSLCAPYHPQTNGLVERMMSQYKGAVIIFTNLIWWEIILHYM